MSGARPDDELYALTTLARADIFDVWSYIAADNEGAADLVEQANYDACAFVAEAPMRGHRRADLTTRSLRFWTLTRYPNYTVVYRPETTPLQVVAVLNGKRNTRKLLKQRQESPPDPGNHPTSETG
jgi:plasmid stabilization system protein ParE